MNISYAKILFIILLTFIGLTPFASAQYDFTGDGVDEILSVSTEGDGIIRWNIIDTTNFDTYFIGGFGILGSQFAVGNWLRNDRANIAVVYHGNPKDRTSKDNRFRLRMPINLSQSKIIDIYSLQRGKKASVLSSADFDGNGYSDIVVIRRGHRKRATWFLNFNPSNFYSAKRRRIRFGDGRDQPITFKFRGGRDSLGSIVIPRGKRALTIKHCLVPCRRNRRIRISNQYIDSENIIPQILKGERDQFLFTKKESYTEKSLNLITLRGKLSTKKTTSLETESVVGNFYDANLLTVNNGKARLKNLETGSEYSIPFTIGKVIPNQIIDHYPKSEDYVYNTDIPFFTSTVTPTKTIIFTPTQTAIITPSIVKNTATPMPSLTNTITPTFTETYTNTWTATNTATITNTITPSVTSTLTPTATLTHTSTPTSTATFTSTATPTQTATPTIDPSAFISTWKTDNSGGETDDYSIKLPLENDGTYNFTVNWGDGNIDTINTWNQAETIHTYANTGTYTVTISGTITGFSFNDTGDKTKIIDISQWGALKIRSDGKWDEVATFSGCSNLYQMD